MEEITRKLTPKEEQAAQDEREIEEFEEFERNHALRKARMEAAAEARGEESEP